ncbi:MAG: ABC transporter permease [Treponema porcinum]|uniref:ABC transporter permease n=3 Tax=Treponema porcinum TaxID=261392 RepID=UPI0023571DBA|nr:ABC transporter permease [Treponema porcinum]MCI6814955.1 ABC transporter permease [Treponema porcinum]MCI6983411.1 ABC transporter permease [Treponema porcinum]MCI7079963.1 ABC transporter permease [Treponema porcinum]MCI7546612.1 ABC transporter permease [Treponema porcinum]MDY5046751.1 ABC transporter permease [Treponema porcinum]
MSRKKTFSFRLSYRWIFDVSRRFASVDRKSRSSATSFLAVLVICFGVMSLVTVVSVMNGFQMSFVNAIMELSSFHIRVSNLESQAEADFLDSCADSKEIRCVSPFYESQALLVGNKSKESAGIIRGVDARTCEFDEGFAREIKIVSGSFDLSSADSIVLGSYLAQSLGVTTGNTVNLLALSGGKDVELLSQNRQFKVTGIFECGYYDINQGYAFVSIEAAHMYFGEDAPVFYGIKIRRPQNDGFVSAAIKSRFPDAAVQSWREYNRTFFGALRVEKNILMLLVFLIFVVVAVNIYNGMRRLVFERSQEIAALSALGGTSFQIKAIFVVRGFLTGAAGTVIGVVLGIFISLNIRSVFLGVSHCLYWLELFFTSVFSPENAAFVTENQMYAIYASIPARIIPSEVLLISLFGVLSPLLASALASRSVLKLKIAEVLHNE